MKKYLKLYKKFMENKAFPFLCNEFGNKTQMRFKYKHEVLPSCDSLFALFIPTEEEMKNHVKDGYSHFSWGVHNNEASDYPSQLRQNILLLMAAMNNEL